MSFSIPEVGGQTRQISHTIPHTNSKIWNIGRRLGVVVVDVNIYIYV